MSSRWFNVVVVLFWISTMSWLAISKIVPPLVRGEPPSYQTIVAEEQKNPEPVAWRLYWGRRPMGRAITRVERRHDDMTEIISQLVVENLPLKEVTPPWLAPVLKFLDEGEYALDLEAESNFAIDPLGRLVGFRSRLGAPGAGQAISVVGSVEGDRLDVVVRSGEFTYRTETYLPRDALVGDALSPRNTLPHLRLGQTWTVPVYSPFRPANSPLEVLYAAVDRDEPLAWGGGLVDTWLVSYRQNPGGAGGDDAGVVGRMWVRHDGTVLKQELNVLDSRLVFVREARIEAQAEDLPQDKPRGRDAVAE